MRYPSSLLFISKKQLYSFVFYSLCLLGTTSLIGQTTFTSFPSYEQLYQREIPNNYATIPVSGTIAQSSNYTRVSLRVSNGSTVIYDRSRNLSFSGGRASFSFSVRIPAELSNHRFDLYGERNGVEVLLRNANKVVVGDVILINGQSNALANAAAKPADFDDFARTYQGAWQLMQFSFPGQWGAHLAKQIIEEQRIPVAIFNQAEGGRSINYFLKNNSNNYSTLQRRLDDGGIDEVANIIWFQGEGDGWGTTIAEYKNDFRQLHQSWKQDYSPQKTYIYQIRFGSCSHVRPYPMEAQRQLAEELSDVGIMSTNNVDHDGCHFPFSRGYQLLAERMFELINRDLYGVNRSDVEAPNISRATLTSSRELRLEFDNTSSLSSSGNPWSEFTLEGSSARVTSGRVVGNEVRLTLSSNVSSLDGVTYLAHIGSARNWVYNSNDVGLLSFYDFPVSQGTATVTPPVDNPSTPIPTDCGDVTIGIGASSITLSGMEAPVVTVQVFRPDWTSAYSCNGDCEGTSRTINNLAEGDYFIRIQLLSASWQLICKVEDYYTVDGSGPATPEAPETPTTPSSGNSCDNINISTNSGGIAVSGLNDGNIGSLLVLSEDWSISYHNCWGNACGSGTITVPVGRGSYRVIAKHYSTSFQEVCQKEEIIAVNNLSETSASRSRASSGAKQEFKVFPTLVVDRLQVQLPKAADYIKIFSQQGQLIQTISVKNWKVEQAIKLDSTAQGMYFINASYIDGTSKTGKFIIR